MIFSCSSGDLNFLGSDDIMSVKASRGLLPVIQTSWRMSRSTWRAADSAYNATNYRTSNISNYNHCSYLSFSISDRLFQKTQGYARTRQTEQSFVDNCLAQFLFPARSSSCSCQANTVKTEYNINKQKSVNSLINQTKQFIMLTKFATESQVCVLQTSAHELMDIILPPRWMTISQWQFHHWILSRAISARLRRQSMGLFMDNFVCCPMRDHPVYWLALSGEWWVIQCINNLQHCTATTAHNHSLNQKCQQTVTCHQSNMMLTQLCRQNSKITQL